MSERAVPFYCPYCGEEDLRPAEQTERVPHGAWYCAACLRTFALKMIGIGVPEVERACELTHRHSESANAGDERQRGANVSERTDDRGLARSDDRAQRGNAVSR